MTGTVSEVRTGLYIGGAHEDAAETFAVHDPPTPRSSSATRQRRPREQAQGP